MNSVSQYLNNLNINRKLILLSVILLLPTLLLFLFFLDAKSYRIDFAAKEEAGMVYLQGVYPLQKAMGEHRGLMAVYLKGDKTVENKIKATESDISELISKLEKQDKESEDEFKTSSIVSEIKSS